MGVKEKIGVGGIEMQSSECGLGNEKVARGS